MEKVALLKVESYNDKLKDKIQELVDLIGGFESYIKRGDRVLLKPNFITARSPDKPVTTNPEFIATVAEILIEHGCKVAIGDSPGLGSALNVTKSLGLFDRLKKYDIKFINFEQPVLAKIPDSKINKRKFKQLYLAGELNEFDKIINLPKLKSHAQMGITLATKNLYGCVVGKEKGQWHFTAGRDLLTFARLIVEIALTVNANLHILDGIEGMDGNGPTNGRKRDTHVALASDNCIALDRVVVELINKKPEDFPIFTAARELSLKGIDLSEIQVLGDNIENLIIPGFQIPALMSTSFVNYELLRKLIGSLINQKILVDYNNCINCVKCKEQCPANAITFDNKINIDHHTCIRCCCCQEICPVGALSVSEPVTLKILKKFGF